MQLLQGLTHLVLHYFDMYKLPTLFVLLVIEEAGIPIPIPGDTLIMLAGTRTHTKTALEGAAVILVSSLAAVAGSSVLFLVMRRGGRPFLIKYGKYIHLSPHQLERVEGWFTRRGRIAIVLGRLIPGLRVVTTVVAGLSGMTYVQYVQLATFAAVIWSAAYFWLGVLIGRDGSLVVTLASDALDYVPKWLLVLGTLLLLASLGVGVTWEWQRRRRAEHAARQPRKQPDLHA
jgi:membrane protein DedA with SNARE-associated domain